MSALVEARNLTRRYPAGRGWLSRGEFAAVNGVSLAIPRGAALGLVGESGCGKSTLGRLLLGLEHPSAGAVSLDGQPVAALRGAAARRVRRRMQIIFQDPFGSLDPRRPVGAQIGDGVADPGARAAETARLLGLVGLEPDAGARLPHAFSGGQRQRIAIARALSTAPDFIVADEPVSALDVSIQAQVVNLLDDLRRDLGLALLFISHDLHVVRRLCDAVAVMYLGRVVEQGPAAAVLTAPAHPYTRALLDATPSLSRGGPAGPRLQGDLPSPANPPSGCAFRTRCPLADAACAAAVPPLAPLPDGRRVACVRPLA
jgi:oligopeptide/dipeptide ABC transporter ATP-binding protein